MELCAGGELFHRLEKQGRFSEHNARIIFKHLMEVVKFCNENGVVHRDLKPENILLATTSSASLSSWQTLALRPTADLKLHGTMGSPFYIAPEVLSGGYNKATDVWSVEVILYILLSGMPPFWGKTKSRIFDAVRAADLRFPTDSWDHISGSAKELVTRMLCVDPSKRLTAEQVLGHSWMEDCIEGARETYNQDNQLCDELEVCGSSFSTPFIARTDNYTFEGNEQPRQSPVFTCKSSFTSFLEDDATPCSASGGFSFGSSQESSAAEFSTPISSMPSFTFSSPVSRVVQGNISLRFKANESSLDVISRDSEKWSVKRIEEEDLVGRNLQASTTKGTTPLALASSLRLISL